MDIYRGDTLVKSLPLLAMKAMNPIGLVDYAVMAVVALTIILIIAFVVSSRRKKKRMDLAYHTKRAMVEQNMRKHKEKEAPMTQAEVQEIADLPASFLDEEEKQRLMAAVKPVLRAKLGGNTAAINGGADAVYFGGKAFNARQRAKNLRDDEMIAMVKLCHSHRVKVYITLNTLVKDEEMEEAMEYIAFLSDLGPDGLIVQDPGLMDFILTHYPHLPLQTSTQASVYGLEGTLFFEELGFKRVVLPREMSLSEVKTISDGSAVELKVFCHGALCYAYSGQCLFSSLVGGRSGNRGLCAQPCRKEYTLKDARGKVLKTGYLMSMKDLNSRDYLEDILASGADSLKIEGRMKN